jgi:hypothetical protein
VLTESLLVVDGEDGSQATLLESGAASGIDHRITRRALVSSCGLAFASSTVRQV